MKNVLIIGASGSLASYVIDELIKQKDVHLTLMLRHKNRLQHHILANTTVVEGDVMNYALWKEAIQGQEIVYVNLAGEIEAMAKDIVKAMHETGVKRIIAISSIGIYETPLRPILHPYRKLADVIEASGLDYTILRPDWFTNEHEVNYEITRKNEPEKGTAVSRKSIASFIATIIETPGGWINENLGISKPT
jgi:uncharacterized protein YbjT (DUF2867 family)